MKPPSKKAKVAKLKAPVGGKDITAPSPAAPDGVEDSPGAPTNLGDWDGNGKPGGDAKAQPKEPRPMPKSFKLETVREGSRVVARQDGIEVPFRHTDDKDEYARREEAQREAMWAALEARRIRDLK